MPRILAIEDDDDLQYLYDMMLSRRGYDVTKANNITDSIVRLTHEPFDLIILDMNMPDFPGTKVIEFVLGDSHLEHIPILIVSANEHWRERAYSLGVKHFLTKPITMQTLIERVEFLLRQ
ncbi:MAG: response regulator [Chloroflexi bacterium]|nr:response regulator [Chloroflexota bacterium]